MRSDAVAAGAVPLLANVLKDGRLLALLASLLANSHHMVVLVKMLQGVLSFLA